MDSYKYIELKDSYYRVKGTDYRLFDLLNDMFHGFIIHDLRAMWNVPEEELVHALEEYGAFDAFPQLRSRVV